MSDRDGSNQIWITDACGGEACKITSLKSAPKEVTWSPDGQRIAFVANRTAEADYTSVTDIWTVPSEGGVLRKVTPGTGPCSRPTFSPDGKSIAYFGHNLEFPGAPWDHMEYYMSHSPIMFVKNITTPVLIIHSENDYRCPVAQGEEFFTALKFLRKTVEFVRFPNESHGLSGGGQPVHRTERLTRMVDWFKKYLKPESSEYCC